ncbi:hypothetical protein RF11_05704 [Thelohanellus kitauei]|uniref:Uncharacterized protein n=1 Tax=Thelohanellus kitauei TaxID=669202 RepID=A0A0C2MTE7_THEKT|nr:hypothetical protein RF11_05704 [Thelohanellus kitauei]
MYWDLHSKQIEKYESQKELFLKQKKASWLNGTYTNLNNFLASSFVSIRNCVSKNNSHNCRRFITPNSSRHVPSRCKNAIQSKIEISSLSDIFVGEKLSDMSEEVCCLLIAWFQRYKFAFWLKQYRFCKRGSTLDKIRLLLGG